MFSLKSSPAAFLVIIDFQLTEYQVAFQWIVEWIANDTGKDFYCEIIRVKFRITFIITSIIVLFSRRAL